MKRQDDVAVFLHGVGHCLVCRRWFGEQDVEDNRFGAGLMEFLNELCMGCPWPGPAPQAIHAQFVNGDNNDVIGRFCGCCGDKGVVKPEVQALRSRGRLEQ